MVSRKSRGTVPLNWLLTFRPARPWPPRGRWPRPGSSPSSGRSAHAQTRSLPGTSYPEHSCIYHGIIPQVPYHGIFRLQECKKICMFFNDLTVVSQKAKNITLSTKTIERISAHFSKRFLYISRKNTCCDVCTSDKHLSDFFLDFFSAQGPEEKNQSRMADPPVH